MFNDPEGYDKINANFITEYHTPPLVERVFRLTPEGQKFIKEHSKPHKREKK